MRIIVMGTGPFAVPTCKRLLAEGHEIPLVVVRPLVDPTAKKLPPTPVRDWARENSLPIFEPQSINDPTAIAELEKYAPELFFVCDYGQILSKACLSVPRLGGINLHGSLLPRHRGAAPVQWALLRGDAEAGVSVIHMTPRLDGGPVLAIASTKIMPDENAGQLEPRLAEIGVDASMQAIQQLSLWDGKTEIGIVQSNEGVTKAPRFAKSHGQLDFRLSAEYLVRLIRALQPWPGTFGELRFPDGKQVRLLIRAARAIEHVIGHAAGTVWPCTTKELGLDWPAPWQRVLAVATGAGTLLIARLQPASKREMDAEEFLRGHALLSGVQFLLPETMLSEL
ncbi:MAG: methionyl-tRNA formyltransferase [Pirellulaceae bacterium]|nr:methionyl-tRNA formyltransferase [Pirellulaceae bacterium]